MEILSGKVVNGHVDFGDIELPEGATVQAFVLDEDDEEMSAAAPCGRASNERPKTQKRAALRQ